MLGLKHFLDPAGLIKSRFVLFLLTFFTTGFLRVFCFYFETGLFLKLKIYLLTFKNFLENRGKDTIKFPICQLSHLIKSFSKADVPQKGWKDCQKDIAKNDLNMVTEKSDHYSVHKSVKMICTLTVCH